MKTVLSTCTYKCKAIALVSVRPLLLLDILTLHVTCPCKIRHEPHTHHAKNLDKPHLEKKPCLFMSHLTRCMEELVKTFDRV